MKWKPLGAARQISAKRLLAAASRSCTHNAPEDSSFIPLVRSVRYFCCQQVERYSLRFPSACALFQGPACERLIDLLTYAPLGGLSESLLDLLTLSSFRAPLVRRLLLSPQMPLLGPLARALLGPQVER